MREKKIRWMHQAWLDNPDVLLMTRRPQSEGEELIRQGSWFPVLFVQTAKGKQKCAVGFDYAIQPGRGQYCVRVHKKTRGRLLHPTRPSPDDGLTPEEWKWLMRESGYVELRMLVTDIREERLQDISEDDCLAEGFQATYDGLLSARLWFRQMWDSLYQGQPGKMWDANPAVWVLSFQLRAM